MHNIDFIRYNASDDWVVSVEITIPGIYNYECEFNDVDNTSNKISGTFLVLLL